MKLTQIITKNKTRLLRMTCMAGISALLVHSGIASAVDLPTVDVPSGSSTDYVEVAKNIILAVFGIVAMILGIAAFIVTAKGALQAYNEWQENKLPLFGFLTRVAVAIGVLIFVIFLLSTIIDAADLEL